MIILNTKEKRVCVVEVPENNPLDFKVKGDRLLYYYRNGTKYDTLPSGNWKILGLLSEITEEQAKRLVEKLISGCYKDYQDSENEYETALESFHSLLRSHNLDTTKNLLIMGEEG